MCIMYASNSNDRCIFKYGVPTLLTIYKFRKKCLSMIPFISLHFMGMAIQIQYSERFSPASGSDPLPLFGAKIEEGRLNAQKMHGV